MIVSSRKEWKIRALRRIAVTNCQVLGQAYAGETVSMVDARTAFCTLYDV
jgi:hypothetical protein